MRGEPSLEVACTVKAGSGSRSTMPSRRNWISSPAPLRMRFGWGGEALTPSNLTLGSQGSSLPRGVRRKSPTATPPTTAVQRRASGSKRGPARRSSQGFPAVRTPLSR
jgi:hypothetical protein